MEASSQSVLHDLLTLIVKAGASDVHLRVGSPASGRVCGELRRFGAERLTAEQMEHFTRLMIARPDQWSEFILQRDADFAYSVPGLARFQL